MRRFVTTTFGLFSAVAGILLIKKDRENALRPVQIVVNELSWFSALVGTQLPQYHKDGLLAYTFYTEGD